MSVIAILFLTLTAILRADDLQPLKQKSDWPAVERLCRQRLRSPSLAPDARAELTSELASSLAQQANADADPMTSERRWTEADQLLADFLEDHPRHARAALLHRQRLIYAGTRGEALRQQAEIVQDPKLLGQARSHLQKAEELGKDLEAAIQKQLDAYTTKQPGQASFEQLVALSSDTPFRLATVRLSLAQTHGPKDPLRGQLLVEAAKGFAWYSQDGFREDELFIRAQLGLARCFRLQGDYAAAGRALVPLEAARSLPLRFQDELLARKMDLLIAQDQPQAARALLQGRSKVSHEAALLNIHALLLEAQQWLAKGDRAAAARLQGEALHRIGIGEREYAAAWTARAMVLLGRHAVPSLPPEDLQSRIRLAESFQRAERWAEAATACSLASETARAAGDPAQAFELALRAGRMLAQAGQNQEAAAAFRRLIAEAPDPDRAAQASLLAAHAHRRVWEADRSPAALAGLQQSVADHLQRYPGDPTAADAHFLAGLVATARMDHAAAIQGYSQVPAQHRLAALALQETLGAYLQLRNAAAEPEAEDRLTREALSYLDRWQQAMAGQNPSPALTLGRARLLVRRTAPPADLRQAEGLLEKVLADRQVTLPQREAAQEALVLVAAALSETAEAERELQVLALEALVRLRQELKRWLVRSPEATQRKLAVVQLAVVRRLAAASPSVELRRDEANCLVLLDRAEEARPLFAALDGQLGRDPGFLQEYAAALLHFATPGDLTNSADLWRRLEQLSTPGSETWFEAKYQLASTLAKSGEKERAFKVLRVTLEVWLNDPTAPVPPVLRQKNRQRFQGLEKQLREQVRAQPQA